MAGAAAPTGAMPASGSLNRRQTARLERTHEVHPESLAPKQRQRHHRRRPAPSASTADAALLAPASDSTSRASPGRAAASSPSSMSNLATYRLPQRKPQQRWLDACIRDAVANLDEAPFLQASSVTPEPQLQRFTVAPQVGDAPQLWDGIVRHLSSSGAETSSVLYVSPVVVSDSDDSADAVSCMAQAACDSAREVLTGIATGSDAPVLEGRIGDCCEGHAADVVHSHGLLGGHQHGSFDSFSSMGASLDSEQHAAVFGRDYKHSSVKASQIVPYVPLQRGGRDHGPSGFDHLPEGHVRAGSSDDGQLQRLWGVVVQSRETGAMDGCYVLKTVSSTAVDCQCTSYTLTKVCEGDFAQQMSGPWL